MSVINTMLQDLEQRRVDMDRSGAYRYVRALPIARQGVQLKTALLAGAGLVLAAAVAYLGTQLWRRAVPGPAVAPVALSAPVPTTVAPIKEAQATAQLPLLSLSVSRELLGREIPPPPAAIQAPVEQTLARAPAPAPQPVRTNPSAPTLAVATSQENPRTPLPDPTPAAPVKVAPPVIERPLVVASAVVVPPHEIKQVSPQQRAESEYRRGSDLLAQGRTPQAMDAFSQALALDAAHDQARHALVTALLRSKNTAEAERLLIERQALPARSAAFAMMLARLQAERGENELALETLRASQPVAGSNPAYYATTAALLARLGQHAPAIVGYQNALRLAPQSGVWWMGLGLSFQAQGSLPEAQEALRRARGSDNLPAELAAFVDQRLKQMQ